MVTQYEIKPFSAIIVGILGSILFGGASFFIFIFNLSEAFKGNKDALITLGINSVFIFFTTISIYLIIYCQKIIIGPDSISIVRLHRTYTLFYSEITYFYEGSGNINLGNSSKQLSFPSFEYWNGKNKKEAFIALLSNLQEKGIERKITFKGIFPHLKGFK